MEQRSGRRVRAIDAFLADRGFVSMLVVRLVPLFPFRVLNLVSGVTALRFRDYVLATAIGIVPERSCWPLRAVRSTTPTSPVFIAAVVGFVLLAVVGGLVARRMKARDRTTADGPA